MTECLREEQHHWHCFALLVQICSYSQTVMNPKDIAVTLIIHRTPFFESQLLYILWICGSRPSSYCYHLLKSHILYIMMVKCLVFYLLLNSVGSDGFHQQLGGCLKDFRNKPYAVRAKVEYYKKALTVRTILCSLNSFFTISWRIEGWVGLGEYVCSACAPVCLSQ